jgi:hypothetical protein
LIIAAIIAIVAAAALIIVFWSYARSPQQSASFSAFLTKFDSSPRVGIYAIGKNGTQLSSAITCSTSVIEQLLQNPKTRRNASTMDYYAMNSTTCDYLKGLGGIQNGSTETPQDCLSAMATEPSIVISYNPTNSTLVQTNAVFFSGNSKFLALCGIAEEIG